MKREEPMTKRVEKPEAEWKEKLSPAEYKVIRQKGTEAPFTGEYVHTKDPGVYRCKACGTPLFASTTKYDSGSGWPSFYEPLKGDNVKEKDDRSLFMTRTEVLCAACDAHLGHVFPDGPNPTGLRYCINSCSLDLDKGMDPEKAGEE
jgi:peptide-methionine (R)-S-oxide reductase